MKTDLFELSNGRTMVISVCRSAELARQAFKNAKALGFNPIAGQVDGSPAVLFTFGAS
jgi:hypothetical protein